jgi:hypothetical protein
LRHRGFAIIVRPKKSDETAPAPRSKSCRSNRTNLA